MRMAVRANGDKVYFKTNEGSFDATAIVSKFTPLNHWTGEWCVSFFALGEMDNDVRGTNGTGMKVYDTKKHAMDAAKRYIKRWENM